jgi:hypothetical protein
MGARMHRFTATFLFVFWPLRRARSVLNWWPTALAALGTGAFLRSTQCECETSQNREVGMKLDALQATHAQSSERVFPLQVRELPFDQSAATVERPEPPRVPRDAREQAPARRERKGWLLASLRPGAGRSDRHRELRTLRRCARCRSPCPLRKSRAGSRERVPRRAAERRTAIRGAARSGSAKRAASLWLCRRQGRS